MLHSFEQLDVYAAARKALPELPTLADLHALKESHAELVTKIAELEAHVEGLGTDCNRHRAEVSELVKRLEVSRGVLVRVASERDALKAQLDRANSSLEDWKQRAGRMSLKAKPLLDRATKPRPMSDAPQTDEEKQLSLIPADANTKDPVPQDGKRHRVFFKSHVIEWECGPNVWVVRGGDCFARDDGDRFANNCDGWVAEPDPCWRCDNDRKVFGDGEGPCPECCGLPASGGKSKEPST